MEEDYEYANEFRKQGRKNPRIIGKWERANLVVETEDFRVLWPSTLIPYVNTSTSLNEGLHDVVTFSETISVPLTGNLQT